MSSLVFAPFLPLAAIATTPSGQNTLSPLCQTMGATLWLPETLNTLEPGKQYSGSLFEHLALLWENHQAFVFSLATGAVIRLIAPLLKNKSCDPAIVVVDQGGRFVISLCSGHQGGADQLTRLIAQQLGATPILTGASEHLGLPGIDILGLPFGWKKGEGDWTGVSSAVAQGKQVEVIQEVGSKLWIKGLPTEHPFEFESCDQPQSRIWISTTQRRFSPQSDFSKVQWHPRVLWVGLGCERGTSKALMEYGIQQVFQQNHLAEAAIAGIATLDLKGDEVGLLQLCQERQWPLKTFSAAILNNVSVPNPSTRVSQEVGTASVAEAAALSMVDQVKSLLVTKQIIKRSGEPGAVTLAIAQGEREYTGRPGQLFLIGTGPGNLDQMTPAAQTAVRQADVIIGYSLYLDLISPLKGPGQIVEAFPITQEKQRSQRAIELAKWGLSVAVVSSGDCGIYGMAGLILEALKEQQWDGNSPQVQVFPGITALQATASRVGAPLMHDFCAISLSDLLTPWEVIEKRLHAAAQADFVTALYNPRSQKRTQQIEIAQQIFLNHRPSHTPVAIAQSVYRPEEQVTLTTLDKMLEFPIDMLTTLIIGNRSTQHYGEWMITPRGYLSKLFI